MQPLPDGLQAIVQSLGRRAGAMSDFIEIGPLALSVERLAAIFAIWLYLASAVWAGRSGRVPPASWIAVGAGILVARLSYVAANLDAFRIEPLSAAYVWQGGFNPAAGVAAAAAVLLLGARSTERSLGLASLAVIGAAWFAATALLVQDQARPLPAVTAFDVAENRVALDKLRGPLVINLWATWCPPCRREMPMIEQTAAAHPDVPVLLLNQGERLEDIEAYLRDEGIAPGRVLLDPSGGLASALNTRALPTTLFIDSKGAITKVHSGEISRAALQSAIRKLRGR